MPLNLLHKIFTIYRKLHLDELNINPVIMVIKIGVTEVVFELLKVEANFKGVFEGLYCCYGNL